MTTPRTTRFVSLPEWDALQAASRLPAGLEHWADYLSENHPHIQVQSVAPWRFLVRGGLEDFATGRYRAEDGDPVHEVSLQTPRGTCTCGSKSGFCHHIDECRHIRQLIGSR